MSVAPRKLRALEKSSRGDKILQDINEDAKLREVRLISIFLRATSRPSRLRGNLYLRFAIESRHARFISRGCHCRCRA
ncbi:MAG: hypothetical protein ABSD28_10360, partial [Tepidisphaeraceae bacterium]